MAVKPKGLRGVSQVSVLWQLAAFCRSSALHRRTTKLPSESQCEQYLHPAEKVCACVIVAITVCVGYCAHIWLCVCVFVCACVCMYEALFLACVVGDDASLAGTSWCSAQWGPNWTACLSCLITNRPQVSVWQRPSLLLLPPPPPPIHPSLTPSSDQLTLMSFETNVMHAAHYSANDYNLSSRLIKEVAIRAPCHT